MGGLRRQSCRIERWRGYIASSFFVSFPDGTRVESSQFKWRRAELPPDLDAARAAYDELVERVAALGWERHADGEPWFATEFVRFVEEPSEAESLEEELLAPVASVQVAPEPLEHEPAKPLPAVHVAPPVVQKRAAPAHPSPPAGRPAKTRRRPAPAAPAPPSSSPAARPAKARRRPAPAVPAPAPSPPAAHAAAHPAALPEQVRRRPAPAVPAPAPSPPAAHAPAHPAALPEQARLRLAAPTPLRRALVRSAELRLRPAHAPGTRRIRFPRVVELLAGMVVIAVVAVVWGVVIHTLTTTPKPVPVRGRPDAVVWGNRVFANRADFAHWLKARGISYRVWVKRHPDAERIISGRARPAVTRRAASR